MRLCFFILDRGFLTKKSRYRRANFAPQLFLRRCMSRCFCCGQHLIPLPRDSSWILVFKNFGNFIALFLNWTKILNYYLICLQIRGSNHFGYSKSEHYWIECSYDGKCAYGQSKLANILHARELAKRLKVCPVPRFQNPFLESTKDWWYEETCFSSQCEIKEM